MPATNTVDRQSLWLLALLVIVGAILCIIGWQRFFTVTIAAQTVQLPAFEVASIRENRTGSPVGGLRED